MKKLLVFLLTTLLMVSACAAADGLTPGDGIVALENGAHIDLDGDGVEETVAWLLDVDEYGFGEMVVSAGSATVRVPVSMGIDAVYAGRLNGGDDSVYLLVGEYGPSDDPMSTLLRCENGAFSIIGTINALPQDITIHSDHLSARVRAKTLQTWWRESDFVIAEFYQYSETDGLMVCARTVNESPRASYTLATGVTLLQDTTLCTSLYGMGTFTLPAGTRCVITASDDCSWIYLSVADETETAYSGGYLMLGEDGISVLQEGVSVPGWELLDGLLFAD